MRFEVTDKAVQGNDRDLRDRNFVCRRQRLYDKQYEEHRAEYVLSLIHIFLTDTCESLLHNEDVRKAYLGEE